MNLPLHLAREASVTELARIAEEGTLLELGLAVGGVLLRGTKESDVAALRALPENVWARLHERLGRDIELLEVRAGRKPLGPTSYRRADLDRFNVGMAIPEGVELAAASSPSFPPEDWDSRPLLDAIQRRDDAAVELALARIADLGRYKGGRIDGPSLRSVSDVAASDPVASSGYGPAVMDWLGYRFVPGQTLIPIVDPWPANRTLTLRTRLRESEAELTLSALWWTLGGRRRAQWALPSTPIGKGRIAVLDPIGEGLLLPVANHLCLLLSPLQPTEEEP